MHAAILLLSLMLPAAAQPAVELKAGIGRVEITPSGLMGMYGYANRKCGPANGTHDPLFAKVLVLEAGDSRIALVTTDLGSFISESLRRDVASKLKIPVLLLSASHTHSAPAFLPFGSAPATDDQSKAYLAEIEGRIFRAIEEASRSMFPARLAIARGSMQLGYNRLLVREDGRARAVFDNLERIPYGPVDPEFVLLRVEDTKGQAKALLVHYAAHAVVLGPTSCKYSADYPGVLQSAVERELKGTQVMFVQGGAGDINPLFQGRSGTEEQDFAVMEKMGQLLAAEVLRVHKTVKPLAPVTDPIRVRSEVLMFPERWEKDKTMEVGITTILLGRELAIATIPGEPFHKLQKTWKDLADVPYPLFYGYTWSAGGTWAGYVPDLHSAAYGGYGADASTRIEIGAGEKIMLRHLTTLYDLLGMWKEKPGRP
jgi:neutral/alkaline ceramidase-like enzyme